MVRLGFYILLVALVAVSVNWKIGIIQEKRSAEVVSINSEYSKYGKPVEVYTVKKQNLDFYEKVSGSANKRKVVAFISQLQWNKIEVGQIAVLSQFSIKGKVINKSHERDDMTGLFQIEVKLEQSLEQQNNGNIVLDIKTKSIPNTLAIPFNAVKMDGEKNFVWMVTSKDIAMKKYIEVGKRSGELTEILDGLDEGVKVIVRGTSLLEKNDQLRLTQEPKLVENTGAKK